MRKYFIMISIVLISLCCVSTVFAGGGCPDGANSLEAYAGCMAVMPGNTGTMYRGNLSQLHDNSHANVIAAMQAAPVVPPHVVSGPAYHVASPVYYMPSMMNVAASRAYQTNNHGAFWTVYMMNNASRYQYPWW
ncbi:MAG: hypothetical protein HN337_05685 [Deltaproteobacteria bacterium]|jgi:hypothetical protein|nr:hypothetical protein [Deltaproteobacteria bacterium]